MAQLLNELHQDHRNISTLLTILKNKLTALRMGGQANFALMAEVFDYLREYGDNYHHAREDKIYQFMMDRYPKKIQLLENQVREHQELQRLTIEIRNSVDRVLMDTPLPLEVFIEQLHQFIEKQAHHLNFEEAKIFPVIEQNLSPGDWEQIMATLPNQDDPLFGERLGGQDERFNNLYEALIEDLT